MKPTAIVSLLLAAALSAAGCHNSHSSTSGRFLPSTTPGMPGLVKMVAAAQSGTRVVIDVTIDGPEPAVDLNGFSFGVRIGDDTLARFVPESMYQQTALVPGDGQSVAITVDDMTDPSVVAVDVEKQGGGAGNGIPGTSAVVIELAFDVTRGGTTGLTLVGVGGNPPRAFSSARAPIGSIVFDTASGTIEGVTTGGSGY
jgi:hypothetical protein